MISCWGEYIFLLHSSSSSSYVSFSVEKMRSLSIIDRPHLPSSLRSSTPPFSLAPRNDDCRVYCNSNCFLICRCRCFPQVVLSTAVFISISWDFLTVVRSSGYQIKWQQRLQLNGFATADRPSGMTKFVGLFAEIIEFFSAAVVVVVIRWGLINR